MPKHVPDELVEHLWSVKKTFEQWPCFKLDKLVNSCQFHPLAALYKPCRTANRDSWIFLEMDATSRWNLLCRPEPAQCGVILEGQLQVVHALSSSPRGKSHPYGSKSKKNVTYFPCRWWCPVWWVTSSAKFFFPGGDNFYYILRLGSMHIESTIVTTTSIILVNIISTMIAHLIHI